MCPLISIVIFSPVGTGFRYLMASCTVCPAVCSLRFTSHPPTSSINVDWIPPWSVFSQTWKLSCGFQRQTISSPSSKKFHLQTKRVFRTACKAVVSSFFQSCVRVFDLFHSCGIWFLIMLKGKHIILERGKIFTKKRTY